MIYRPIVADKCILPLSVNLFAETQRPWIERSSKHMKIAGSVLLQNHKGINLKLSEERRSELFFFFFFFLTRYPLPPPSSISPPLLTLPSLIFFPFLLSLTILLDVFISLPYLFESYFRSESEFFLLSISLYIFYFSSPSPPPSSSPSSSPSTPPSPPSSFPSSSSSSSPPSYPSPFPSFSSSSPYIVVGLNSNLKRIISLICILTLLFNFKLKKIFTQTSYNPPNLRYFVSRGHRSSTSNKTYKNCSNCHWKRL